MKKSISIIMPVYNAAPFLKQSIESILNQTFTDFELICINDASTDDSMKILRHYERKDKSVSPQVYYCCILHRVFDDSPLPLHLHAAGLAAGDWKSARRPEHDRLRRPDLPGLDAGGRLGQLQPGGQRL